MLELRKLSRRGGKETWHRIEAPGLNPIELVEASDDEFEPLGKEVIVYRMWQRHPAYSKMADAPMRSVLADCEEIVRCTHTINARLISRLSGPGIFAIPMSWKVKPLEEVAGENVPEEDPFQVRLTQAMIAAIGTPGSAESVAPIVVRVPDELTGTAHLYKIWDPTETIREIDLREKAVHRFAVGVDMPPAKVEGIEGSNHWNAWAIDKEGVEHLTPVAMGWCYDLASAYLRPTLRDSYKKADWDRFTVGFDAAGAIANPDALKDALEMYNARVVNKAYVREAGNATDDDAMDDEELREALFVATSQVVDVTSGAIQAPEPVMAETEPPVGDETDQDMPEEPDEAEVLPIAAAANGNGELMVMAQAELALLEIRASIGRRVRNHLAGGKCPECIESVKATPAHQLVAELGEDVVAEHEVDLQGLAENTGASFGWVLESRGVLGNAGKGAAGAARAARRLDDLRRQARAAGWVHRTGARARGCMRLRDYVAPVVAQAGPETNTMGMVAVYPTAEEAEALAVEGGLEPDDLHCTLVFLGDLDELPDAEIITAAVAGVALELAPLAGMVGGVGRFTETADGVPVLGTARRPGLDVAARASRSGSRRGRCALAERSRVPAAHDARVRGRRGGRPRDG